MSAAILLLKGVRAAKVPIGYAKGLPIGPDKEPRTHILSSGFFPSVTSQLLGNHNGVEETIGRKYVFSKNGSAAAVIARKQDDVDLATGDVGTVTRNHEVLTTEGAPTL
ncbi:hypothetical protein LTR10_021380 [Elasticomyces elasticus]|uniref:Uncharacterized protein n=1 Tax=Exophiala sideris TaxID=1016849 RepID=A0ABR0JH60_9EURO|nr:hypothetical protein LTR10_021380 [Elasticomyces elasticus]KAK5033400.1 hypothetical protein LTS07_003703 [Exophiala sideris]KAK5042105.1 hypothetical protein LTR13_001911 [Exophiala sideris]KAK5063944.1 hypothetical protein LTR69_003711 [Exophiala sideris]KAK5185373.1 hypothetical protein LTR44_002362 [Eurotiomycetes sp. CCFEE 6388]